MAMAVMRIPYVDISHAIPYSYIEEPVTKRSAGISKFDQAKVTDFQLHEFSQAIWQQSNQGPLKMLKKNYFHLFLSESHSQE